MELILPADLIGQVKRQDSRLWYHDIEFALVPILTPVQKGEPDGNPDHF